MTVVAELLCPECGTPYEAGDFLCTNCELLLDMDAAAGDYKPREPTIVRALMAPPQQRASGAKSMPPGLGKGKKSDPEMTVRATVIMDEYTIPRMVAGLEVALSPLHPFEAHVASFVDGTNSVPQIALAAEISKIEAAAIFQSLAQRKIVELHRNEPPRKPPPQAVPAPPPAAPPPPPAPAPAPAPAARMKSAPTPPPPAAPPPPREVTSGKVELPRNRLSSLPPPTPKPRSATLQERPPPRPPPSPPKAESVLERAISLERRGEVEGAITVLKRAITNVSNPAALCNKLALILVNQRKDYKQAEELLHKAIELEPDNAVYQQNLYKIVGLVAQKREAASSRGPGGSKGGGGFLSKLLKK
jgi:tetratricopeptide (TPR) repeat protein